MFSHEKLMVYQKSLDFVGMATDFLEILPKKLSVHDQLDRASTSIALNIAEGNGKYTEKDRCRFFDIARGSALECAACLDVSVRKKCLTGDQIKDAKILLEEIVSMLIGLVRSQSDSRVYEESPEYGVLPPSSPNPGS